MKWHYDEQPKESGWYIRDYRKVNIGFNADPFSVDEYVIHEVGRFWYVSDEKNDARFTNLPWAKIKDYK
jgi:hypothetical protein